LDRSHRYDAFSICQPCCPQLGHLVQIPLEGVVLRKVLSCLMGRHLAASQECRQNQLFDPTSHPPGELPKQTVELAVCNPSSLIPVLFTPCRIVLNAGRPPLTWYTVLGDNGTRQTSWLGLFPLPPPSDHSGIKLVATLLPFVVEHHWCL
jgi:hypothetical protein